MPSLVSLHFKVCPVPFASFAALTGKPGLAAFRKRGGAGAGKRQMGMRAFGGGSSSDSSGGASDEDEEEEKSEDDAVSASIHFCLSFLSIYCAV